VHGARQLEDALQQKELLLLRSGGATDSKAGAIAQQLATVEMKLHDARRENEALKEALHKEAMERQRDLEAQRGEGQRTAGAPPAVQADLDKMTALATRCSELERMVQSKVSAARRSCLIIAIARRRASARSAVLLPKRVEVSLTASSPCRSVSGRLPWRNPNHGRMRPAQARLRWRQPRARTSWADGSLERTSTTARAIVLDLSLLDVSIHGGLRPVQAIGHDRI